MSLYFDSLNEDRVINLGEIFLIWNRYRIRFSVLNCITILSVASAVNVNATLQIRKCNVVNI